MELRPRVAAVSVELEQEWVDPEQGGYQQHTTITGFAKRSRFTIAQGVLDVGDVDDGLHQQALRVDRDVALLAPDFFARVIAGRSKRAFFLHSSRSDC